MLLFEAVKRLLGLYKTTFHYSKQWRHTYVSTTCNYV